MTTYVAALALSCTNQEGLQESISLSSKEGSTIEPLDLTGAVFKAQVKKTRSIHAAPMAIIDVTVVGDPTEGKLELSIPEATMETLAPGSWFYDLNIKFGTNQPDCLFIAPFVVEPGVSKWT